MYFLIAGGAGFAVWRRSVARETLSKYTRLSVTPRVHLQGELRRQYREYWQEVQRSQVCAAGRALRGLLTRQISALGFLEMFSTFRWKPSLIFDASVGLRRAYLLRGSLGGTQLENGGVPQPHQFSPVLIPDGTLIDHIVVPVLYVYLAADTGNGE